jgi:predicted O-methyltransferase YrrM
MEARTSLIPKYKKIQNYPKIKFLKKKEHQKNNQVYDSYKFFVSDFLKKIFISYKLENAKGEKRILSSSINPPEGFHLYSLVKENKLKKVLEVGMAYGVSSLYICQGFEDSGFDNQSLVSIDPYQSTQWENIGILNLEKEGLSKYSSVIEEKSFVAMSKLFDRGYKFDLIFIDGMHLFDYTISDLYYANKLIKIGGIILLDDIVHKGVERAYNYVLKNYTHWKLLDKSLGNKTTATFVKISEDVRPWDFHVDI